MKVEKYEKGRKRGTMGKSSCYYTVCVELSAGGSVGIMDCSIHWMAVESHATDVG